MNLFHLVSTGKLATRWFNQLFIEINKQNKNIECIPWGIVKDINGVVSASKARTLNPDTVNLNPNTLYYNVNYDYISFKNKIKKTDTYKGVYIYRDPRELIMSSYYSWRFSHPGGHEKRKHLQKLNKDDGLKYVIDQTNEWNEWEMIKSWGTSDDKNIIKLKFEDIFGTDDKQNNMINKLNKIMGLNISDGELSIIKDKMKYSNFSNGRDQGQTDNNHHYRSGGNLTWMSEMSDDVLHNFYEVTGDLIEILGYEK